MYLALWCRKRCFHVAEFFPFFFLLSSRSSLFRCTRCIDASLVNRENSQGKTRTSVLEARGVCNKLNWCATVRKILQSAFSGARRLECGRIGFFSLFLFARNQNKLLSERVFFEGERSCQIFYAMYTYIVFYSAREIYEAS